ncbi:MAG: MGMT family protein [Clostridiales bacterium]|nr:MGMT family protein [Clostridiales bacterium]
MNTFTLIYEQVRRIPAGKVSTYGQIARMIGNPRLSRVVGYALKAAPEGLPCHRVVTKDGDLSDAFTPMGKETHRMLLELEGVGFTEDGRVDMEAFFWRG